MEFHYQEHHRLLSADCPSKDYKPLKIRAYRWVFEKGDLRSFQSQFEKDKERKKPPIRYNDMSDLEKCERATRFEIILSL